MPLKERLYKVEVIASDGSNAASKAHYTVRKARRWPPVRSTATADSFSGRDRSHGQLYGPMTVLTRSEGMSAGFGRQAVQNSVWDGSSVRLFGGGTRSSRSARH